jgi:micrococcal nuclease
MPTAPAAAPVIEWNSVQAVPTRKPDTADIAWARRSTELEGASPAQAQGQTASFGYCYQGGGLNCVVDGDTFYFEGEKVRIVGIDAPETHPPRCDYESRLGNEATEKLHELLNSGAVTMTSIDRDRDVYGRLLRNVQVDGNDVGESMIAAGVARAYGSGRRPWC